MLDVAGRRDQLWHGDPWSLRAARCLGWLQLGQGCFRVARPRFGARWRWPCDRIVRLSRFAADRRSLETVGRLRYIDGCSDTLLICPPRVGEPCLNHLHIPPHTDQTPHTHPSARDRGHPARDGRVPYPGWRVPLRPGMGWYISRAVACIPFHRGNGAGCGCWHPTVISGRATMIIR